MDIAEYERFVSFSPPKSAITYGHLPHINMLPKSSPTCNDFDGKEKFTDFKIV